MSNKNTRSSKSEGFAMGDVVRLTRGQGPYPEGTFGIIIRADANGWIKVGLNCKDNTGYIMTGEGWGEIEKVEKTDTELDASTISNLARIAIIEALSIAMKQEKECKTYLQDLLDKFPDFKLDGFGVPCACRNVIYENTERCCRKYDHDCKSCWNDKMAEKSSRTKFNPELKMKRRFENDLVRYKDVDYELYGVMCMLYDIYCLGGIPNEEHYRKLWDALDGLLDSVDSVK